MLFRERDKISVGGGERWLENPYWQYFTGGCGQCPQLFQTTLPCDPSSLVRWRKLLGEAGLEELLAQTIAAAREMKAIDTRTLERVIIDTTVQERAVTFPTDSRLLEVARKELVSLAQRHPIPLRQSYARTPWLERAERLYRQRPKDKDKLYALHAPEVECIGKGKARQPCEFGVKVGIAITARQGLIVGARSFPGNLYDGDTLQEQLEQVECATYGYTANG